MLTFICSVIFCIFTKASVYQCHCVIETLHDAEFSINVTQSITVESGHCIVIPYEITYKAKKVTVPFKVIWFQGDPQKYINEAVVKNGDFNKDTLKLNGLPQGEYEYGFKLEWGCNQTYTFPKRVRISVSALSLRPTVVVPPLIEGKSATLNCSTSTLCSGPTSVYWKWTRDNGTQELPGNTVSVTPKAEDHNTNVTCVAVYDYNVVETTVALTVKSPPKFLNGSQCVVQGKLLTCVCISQGIPLPPITWPLASLTDYSVIISADVHTVKSTITMPSPDNHNISIKCISSNEFGQVEFELPLHTVDSSLTFWWLGENLPWITTGLSMSLNVALLSSLIICTCKRKKRTQWEPQADDRTYESLSKQDGGDVYSVISPHPQCGAGE